MPSFSHRLQNAELLTFTGSQTNVGFGLGLFDVCPARDEFG